MWIQNRVKAILPSSIKEKIRHGIFGFSKKHDEELAGWRNKLKIDNEKFHDGRFHNEHYEQIMLAMAEEPNDDFLKGKIVADFGCGPRGSLVWAKSALIRIGIDVLADRYADEFKDNVISYGMIYVKSTEHVIPLPSEFVDVLFTLNSIDHVDNFSEICKEIVRVLKPGGLFIGSFNLEEPPTSHEPQQLNEDIVKKNLLDNLELLSYRITARGPENNFYGPFFEGNLSYQKGQLGYLWAKARKRN